MKLQWTTKAQSDLVRLHHFLSLNQASNATHTVQALAKAPACLLLNPRLGERLDAFSPREVRRIFVNAYEIRYEIATETITILRLWHTREMR